MNHSFKVARIGKHMDYLGIMLLEWSASMPLIYYGFHCDPVWRNIHWLLVGLTCHH